MTMIHTKKHIRQKILFYELTGFGIIIVLIWLDEILDLPHNLFGFQATPINWVESLFETVVICPIAVFIMGLSINLLNRTLEGFLPICAHCKRIRKDDNSCLQIESYISKKTNADFTHGICPDCMKEHYGMED